MSLRWGWRGGPGGPVERAVEGPVMRVVGKWGRAVWGSAGLVGGRVALRRRENTTDCPPAPVHYPPSQPRTCPHAQVLEAGGSAAVSWPALAGRHAGDPMLAGVLMQVRRRWRRRHVCGCGFICGRGWSCTVLSCTGWVDGPPRCPPRVCLRLRRVWHAAKKLKHTLHIAATISTVLHVTCLRSLIHNFPATPGVLRLPCAG